MKNNNYQDKEIERLTAELEAYHALGPVDNLRELVEVALGGGGDD